MEFLLESIPVKLLIFTQTLLINLQDIWWYLLELEPPLEVLFVGFLLIDIKLLLLANGAYLGFFLVVPYALPL